MGRRVRHCKGFVENNFHALPLDACGLIVHYCVMNFRDIIDCWPDTYALAEDVGYKQDSVRKWRERNSIPVEAWAAMLNSKTARKKGITAVKLIAAVHKK